ncbi:rhombosortase [Variovorax sp. IB41]|uniref:rhombosortase n=1 Tax=Variovorax sp. IB41 TaxID=2779370 RepID=UPI0018E76084|nr:rhombosortase [Variovorax sp. IB41]MBJ2154312.1 rhombosortase [Variovorax sp. IB41]
MRAHPSRSTFLNLLTPVALAFLIVLFQMGGAPVYELLRYERQAVFAGEWWRLVTSNFVHLGWAHCLLNLAGLAVCAVFAADTRSWREWASAIGALALGVGLLLLLASPRVGDYAGLSGVLYGLFVWVLAPRAWRGGLVPRLALAFVCARIAWQMLFESPGAASELIGGHVVAEGHLYGALCAIAVLGWEGLRARKKSAD